MLGRILLFKITNTGWSNPAYIAACSEEDAKRVAYTLPSNGTLMMAEILSDEDIPRGAFVNTDILDYQDSKAVADRFNAMAGQSIGDRRKQHGFDQDEPKLSSTVCTMPDWA